MNDPGWFNGPLGSRLAPSISRLTSRIAATLDRRCFQKCIYLKSLDFSRHLFRRASAAKQIWCGRNHFPLWRRHPESADGYQPDNENGGQRRDPKPGAIKKGRSSSTLTAPSFLPPPLAVLR